MRTRPLRILYNLLFKLFFIISAPYYLLRLIKRGNWKEGFWQRFGRYPARIKAELTNKKVIWVHGVSVGEINLAIPLVEHLQAALPTYHFVISTTTTTGMDVLKNRAPSYVTKIYYPLDFKKVVRRAIHLLHPQAVIIIEAEIWPNFIWALKIRKTPVFLVNARISEHSYRRYRRFKFFFETIFRTFQWVGAQSVEDSRRLIDLGCKPEAVEVVGSLKYDSTTHISRSIIDPEFILKQLGIGSQVPILVAGSTHEGEEEMIARIYLELKKEIPNLFLIIVPRHYERGKEIGEMLERLGIKFLYRRAMTSHTHLEPGQIECLLVNTTGELRDFYKVATVVFVGKSMYGRGGQNPIEPAALGKPIVFGPYMDNFTKIAEDFVRSEAAIQVSNEQELKQAIKAILVSPQLQQKLGKNAIEVVKRNTGALTRTVEAIIEILQQTSRDKIH